MKRKLVKIARKNQASLLLGLIILALLFYLYSRWVTKSTPTLQLKEREFWINGKPLRILSGSIHYFRVPPNYWGDRLRKAKAMGLNTVMAYVPWNIHEPSPGRFNFKEIYDVTKFILEAQEVGLYVIVRPGPYICAEWDWGGLPSWLLKDKNMRVRSTYAPFLAAVDRYFDKLLPMLAQLQANRGGPIIAFQVENEYGSYGNDIEYMKHIYKGFRKRGITELLTTSDNDEGLWTTPPPNTDVLTTINGARLSEDFIASYTDKLNPEYPLMVSEFWVGWYTMWGEKRSTRDGQEMTNMLKTLLEAGFSVNFYMFHGGTNFGFTNGALHSEHYTSDITSYDYDAPLTENGDITEKYRLFRNILSAYQFGRTIPDEPKNIPTASYGDASMHLYLPILETIIYLPNPAKTDQLISMEEIPINRKGGQRFGYVLYRTRTKSDSKMLTVENCFENQTGVIMVNNKHLVDLKNYNKLSVGLPDIEGEAEYVIDILYEGLGRVNYGDRLDYQRQRLIGPVKLDGETVTGWRTYAIEFLPNYLSTAEAGGIWKRMPSKERMPMLVKGTFEIQGIPKDTFADMSKWGKGVLFINQVNLGRYWKIGPQQTLYVPANVLRTGINKIMVFETDMPPIGLKSLAFISFLNKPYYNLISA